MTAKKEKPLLSEEEKKRNRKVFWISLAITLGVSVLLAVGSYFLARGRFNEELWEEKKLVIWVDTISIPPVILFLIWCLMKLSGAGAFDAIVYSVRLVLANVFHPDLRKSKLPRTYAEYKEMKHGKAPKDFTYILWVCLPYAIAAIVLLIIYFINK